MKRFIQSLFIILSIFGILPVACSDDREDKPEPLLTVSSEDVVFGAENKSVTIDVTTNEKEWDFIIGADWLSCKKMGNKLVLDASVNNTGVARYSTLIVTAGRLTRHIDLTQMPEGSTFSTKETSYSLGQWAEKWVIPILSQTASWKINVSEDWLTAIPNRTRNEILVDVSANFSREERFAIILVEDEISGKSLSIEIKQSGMLWFILPYLTFGDGIKKIEDFEAQRRSIYYSTVPSSGKGDTWVFNTHSPIFHRIEYTLLNGKLVRSTVYAPIHLVKKELDGLFEFIEANGYTEEKDSYVNRAEGVLLQIGQTPAGDEVALSFEYLPIQTDPQPTFSTFPLGFAAQENWQTKGEADITAWAGSNGFAYNEALSKIDDDKKEKRLTYVPTDASNDLSQVVFMLSTDPERKDMPIVKIFMIYKAQPQTEQKFFWEKHEQYYLTNEFLELGKASGFAYVRQQPSGIHVFRNNKTSTLFGVVMIIPEGNSKPFVFTQIEYSK